MEVGWPATYPEPAIIQQDEAPGLLRLLHEDWETNRRDWTRPGFRALAVYRFGVWHSRLDNRVARRLLRLVYRSLHRYVRNRYGIELHHTAKVGRRVAVDHQGAIVIHPFAQIGDGCRIRQGVTLGTATNFSRAEAPKLGNDVILGAGAVIIGKVTVGDGARIGPNAVVMSDVPPGATAFATPARIIFPPDAAPR